MTLSIVSDKRLDAVSDAAEIADMLQGFVDRIRSGEMGATNAVVMVVDKSEMDMFDLNFDVHGRYLEGLGMLQVMQARMMEDILG